VQTRRIVTVHGPVVRVNDGFEEAHKINGSRAR
jgi:hypothetical protein